MMTEMNYSKLFCVAAIGLVALQAASSHAADIKIGFIGTLSGPLAAVGQDQLDGFLLGLEQRDGKLGGKTIEIIKEDDQLKPEVGVQAVQKLIMEDKVSIVTGVTYTNVALAIVPKLLDAGVIVLGSSSGPAAFAGKGCSPNYFSLSFENASLGAGIGAYAQKKGYKRIVAMGPNYAGWNEQLDGFRSEYKGTIVKELHTPMSQSDLSAEIAQVGGETPDAVFVHYAGGMAVNFVKQFVQAGMNKRVPLITVATLDGLSLPALRESAIGAISVSPWSPDIKNTENVKFVEAFEKRFKRIPSNHAAQSFDAAALLDSALTKVGGNISARKELLQALAAADFKSVRGSFKFNKNQFPIEDFRVLEVAYDSQKRVSLSEKDIALSAYKDLFADQCMPQ
jgi:branched-chain amino acid transport system substrate-binding protein